MSYIQQLKNLCTAYCDAGIKCKQNESMANHVSMKTGGNAALVVWPNSRRQLIQVLNLWREAGSHCPIRVIGAGNQILFSDRGYHGLVVITTNVNRVVFEEDEAEDRESFRRERFFCQVYAECGASLTAIAQACGEDARALSGLEFAYGLPGTVGGATVVNAGAFGSDMERVLVSSEYYDLSTGDIVRLMDDQMDLDYRHSIYMDHPDWVVLSSVMTLSYEDADGIRDRMEMNWSIRREKQPWEHPTSAQIFKRPADAFAGRLIENVGLKGYTIGGAQVSEKHAGFIVNRGGASTADVLSLIRHVQDTVEKECQRKLVCRLRVVTDDTGNPNTARNITNNKP